MAVNNGKSLHVSFTWFYRRIWRIQGKEDVLNEKVLKRIDTTKQMFKKVTVENVGHDDFSTYRAY